MGRIKAHCQRCERTILLWIDEEREEAEILELEKGEMFEHQCPNCSNWTAFEVAE
jgi:hypothetical protein